MSAGRAEGGGGGEGSPVAAQAAIVGRDAEMEVLAATLESALAGDGGVLLLVGEAGLGKTELATEVARRASTAGAAVAWSRCWDAGGAPPLWPWMALLRSLDEAIGDEPDDCYDEIKSSLQSLMSDPVASSSDRTTDADRFALFEDVDGLLNTVSRGRPLVLIFDDLHAADEASLQILRFVARNVRGRRILIIGTYLENQIKDLATASLFGDLLREGRRIELPPLTLDAARALYQKVVGSEASEPLLAELHSVSEGNPFLLREAAHSFSTASGVRRGDHSLGFRVPRGARDIMRRRLAPLPARVLRVLTVAAVIGRDFESRLVGEIAETDDAALFEALETAAEAGVVRQGPFLGTYSFSHILLRETLYEDLRMSDRMKLHERVTEIMEKRYEDDLDAHVNELAHHSFKAAQAGSPTKTVSYSEKAAVAATGRGAHAEAVRLYQRALKAAELGGVGGKRRDELAAALKMAEEASAAGSVSAAELTNTTLDGASLKREGDFWRVAYGGKAIALKDSKGVAYLQRLLQSPGREIHVLELIQIHASAGRDLSASSTAASAPDVHPIASGGGEPLLDPEAKRSYGRRIEELRAEVDEAQDFNDPERAARAQAELDAITEHLAAAMGLGGRDRQASSEAERARLSVGKAIRSVVGKVDATHPELGEHLRATIRTGFYCSYQPDPRSPVRWTS